MAKLCGWDKEIKRMKKEKKFFKNFMPYFKDKIGQPLNFLEVGVFSGTTSKLILDNILLHENCLLIGIDPWNKAFFDRHDVRNDEAWENVLQSIENLKKEFVHKVQFLKGTLQDSIVYTKISSILFDGVYIDGEHTYSAVMNDFNLTWPLLKVNGVMIFDDYLIRDRKTKKYDMNMQYVIDRLLSSHHNKCELLFKNEQVGIRKTHD